MLKLKKNWPNLALLKHSRISKVHFLKIHRDYKQDFYKKKTGSSLEIEILTNGEEDSNKEGHEQLLEEFSLCTGASGLEEKNLIFSTFSEELHVGVSFSHFFVENKEASKMT